MTAFDDTIDEIIIEIFYLGFSYSVTFNGILMTLKHQITGDHTLALSII